MVTSSRRPALLLAVGTFTLGVDGFVLAGLLPQVAASLEISQALAGQLTTIFAITYAIASPVIATVTGSWERRTVLLAGLTVFLAGMVFQGTGSTFALVATGRVLAAIGAAGFQATAYATAGLISTDAERAGALAIVAGGSSLSLVAGLPLGILLGQLWGWRSAIWVLVGLAVLSGLAVLLLPAVRAPRTSLGTRLRVLADRRVLGILLGTVLALAPAFLIAGYLPTLLGTAGVLVVVAVCCQGVGQLVGTITVPRVVSRLGARRGLVLGVGMTTAAVIVLVVLRSSPVGVVVLAGVGFGIGLSIVPQQHRLFALVPRVAPVAVGLNGSAIYVGSALGIAVGGSAVSLGGAAALAPAAAGLGLVGIVVAAAVRPERGSRS